MKRVSAWCLALYLSATCAFAYDIRTRDGQLFTECNVTGVTKTNIHVSHSRGVTTIDFRDLPTWLQQHLHYDAKKGETDYLAAGEEAYNWCAAAQHQAEEVLARKSEEAEKARQIERRAKEEAEALRAQRISEQRRKEQEDAAQRAETATPRREANNPVGAPDAARIASAMIKELDPENQLAFAAKLQRFDQLTLAEKVQLLSDIYESSERMAKRTKPVSRQAQRAYSHAFVPNGYGFGVNKTEYGAATVYRYQDGRVLAPIYNDKVRRNAYGFGTHAETRFTRSSYRINLCVALSIDFVS